MYRKRKNTVSPPHCSRIECENTNIGRILFTALMRERQKALKQAAIGGQWSLSDPNGVKRSTDDFKGKWCMIYFGFTHCPGWF